METSKIVGKHQTAVSLVWEMAALPEPCCHFLAPDFHSFSLTENVTYANCNSKNDNK